MPKASLVNLDRLAAGDAAIASDLLANLQSLRDAVNGIDAEQINTDAVTTGKIIDGAVTTDKIANSALTADSAGRAKMVDSFVVAAKLAAAAVETAKIKDEAVTVDKMAPSIMPQIFIGSYTGNGSATGPEITGVGFQPLALFVVKDASDRSWLGFDGDGATATFMNARSLWDAGSIEGTDMFLLNSDGFDLKVHSGANTPNESGVDYFFIAIGVNI